MCLDYFGDMGLAGPQRPFINHVPVDHPSDVPYFLQSDPSIFVVKLHINRFVVCLVAIFNRNHLLVVPEQILDLTACTFILKSGHCLFVWFA